MRKAQDSSQALAAFVARKSEIDAILTRLAALSAEHFDRAPDDISWADIGTLGSYLQAGRPLSKRLRRKADHRSLERKWPPATQCNFRNRSLTGALSIWSVSSHISIAVLPACVQDLEQ
jgi:hypothetical protein